MGFSKRGWNEVWELDEKVVYLTTENSGSEKRHRESERILGQRQWKIKTAEVWSTVVLSSHRHLWCGRGLHLMHFKDRSPPTNYQWPTQNQSKSSGRVGAIWEDSRTWRQLDSIFLFRALTSSNRSTTCCLHRPVVRWTPTRFSGGGWPKHSFQELAASLKKKSHFEKLSK